MKLLIIAGPYEADRLRRAAVAAGFETVAVEPGESLSGWITASRPDLIVMAPHMVHPDPSTALSKVRQIPRGRVPIFLVGDAADEPRLTGLAEAFFVRPVSPEALLERAQAILSPATARSRRARTSEGLGPGAQEEGTPAPVAAKSSGPLAVQELDQAQHTPRGGPSRRPGAGLRPLVADPAAGAPAAAPVGTARAGGDPALLLAELGAGIDALLDAELGNALARAPKRQGTAPLGTLGSLGSSVRTATGVPRPPTGPLPAPPRAEVAGAVSPAPSRSGALRARLVTLRALVEDGDYFQLLGLPASAGGDDVRAAHARLRHELSPEEIDVGVDSEVTDALGELRAVVDEAARVLGDDRLRPRYAAAVLARVG